jgi:hypothetical protein
MNAQRVFLVLVTLGGLPGAPAAGQTVALIPDFSGSSIHP